MRLPSNSQRDKEWPHGGQLPLQPGDLAFGVDTSGRIMLWNAEIARVTGITATEATAKPLERFISTTSGTKIDLAAVRGGRDFAGGVEVRHRDGRLVRLYVLATALRDATGAVTGVICVGRETSDSWRAQESARNAEDKYRLLFEHTTDSVAIADMEGHVLDANARCLQMYGYSAEEIRRMNLVDVVIPESADDVREAMSELAAGRTVAKLLKMRRKDGTAMAVDLLAYVLDVGGERRIFSVTRDVTAREEATEKVRLSEEKYRRMFEAANDAAFLETLDGRILDANENASRLLGYSHEELLRLRVDDLVPPDVKGLLGQVQQTLLTRGSFRAEAANRRKDGSVVPVAISVSLFEVGDEKLVLALVRDVTERRRQQEELAKREARLRLMFEQLPAVVWTTDTALRFTSSSGAGLAGLGLVPGQVVGQSLFEYFRTTDADLLPIAVHRQALRGEPGRYQFEWDGRAYETVVEPLRDAAGLVSGTVGVARDVTDRVLAERALREREENFRALAENASDAVVITDANGRLVYANQSVAKLYGQPVDSLLGKPFLGMIRPQDREVIQQRQALRLSGEPAPSNYELTIQRSDGTEVPLDVAVTSTVWRGEPATLSIARDISGRKAAEKALRDSEANFRSLAESASDGIKVVSLETRRLVYANSRLAQILGRDVAELYELRMDELIHPDDRRQLQDLIDRRRHGGPAPTHYETGFLRADGTRAAVEVATSDTVWHGEKARLLVLRDITERKRAEHALRESEARYRALVEASPDAVALVETDGRVRYASPRLAEMYGFDADGLVGEQLATLAAGEARTRAEQAVALTVRGSGVQSLNIECLRKDGTRFPGELSTALLSDEHGTARGVVCILRDVSERFAADAALRESEARYRQVIDSMADGVHLVSPDLRIVLTNSALLFWLAELGLPARIEGLPVAEAFPFLPEKVLDEYRTVLRTGKPLVTEEVTRVAGRDIVTETRKVPVVVDGAVAYVLTVLRDITERKRAEQELRESEGQFRTLAAESPNMVFINAGGRVVYTNDRSVELLGYTLEEFYAPDFDFMKLIAPESQGQIRLNFARHAKGFEVEPYEYALLTKSGDRLDAIITTRLIDLRGTKAILGVVTNITARVRAETELRESEERYRELVDMSPDGVAVHQNGKIVLVNPSAARMMGYDSPQEMVGLQVIDIVHPDDWGLAKARIIAAVTERRSAPAVEERLRRKDGSYALVEVVTAPMSWYGAPAVQVVVRDISARRQAEAQLRESEERYRRLVEVSPDGIAVHQNGRVVLMNRAGARLLGYDDPSATLGVAVEDFLHPEERAAVLDRMRQVLVGGSTGVPARARFRRRDGSYVMLEVTNATLVWQGKLAIQVVFRDVSAREAAELALRESEERFRTLFQQSPDGIAVYQDGVVVLANPACARLLGYDDVEQLVGRPASSFVMPEDLPQVEERVELMRRGGAAASPLVVRFLARDGRAIPSEVVGVLTAWHGKPAMQVMARPAPNRTD